MKEIKDLSEEIKLLRKKKNNYYKLINFVNSEEKKVVKRQIKELARLIQFKKTKIKRIRTENYLDVIYSQIEKKIAREGIFI